MQILEETFSERNKPSVPSSVDHLQATVYRVIQHHRELRPDQPAVMCSRFATLSYRELQCLIDEVRRGLRLAGFSRNARIGVALPDGPLAALAIVAITCSAIAVPLNPKLTLDEIETCLAALRPDAVLLVKDSDSAARCMVERKGIPVIEVASSKGNILGFSIGAPKTGIAPASNESDEPDSDATAFILQTSGTTLEPKLIPYSHRNMLAAAARAQAWFELTPQDRCLSVSPVHYALGLKVTVFIPLLTGGTIAFPTDISMFNYVEWFGRLKPTWYASGPTLHRLILDQVQSADVKTDHSLRLILSSGAPLPRNVLEGLQRTLGVPVVEHYSSSEVSFIAANLPRPGCSKLDTCGVPPPNTVIIAGEDGCLLPPGEQGEILVQGPTLISGYLDAPELNRTRFIDGWFKTGDIGSLDENGFLMLHGRKDEVINRGGNKISPMEIDDVLLRHPAVAEAAAFAVPHSRLGQDVVAAVVLRPGMTVTPVELRRYIYEKVASFKVPRRILIRDQLPKGKVGKVLRRRLAELWEEKAEVERKLVIQLTQLWERLLRTAPLSQDDDFYEKGGDSVLAMAMLMEVEQLTDRVVPSSILLEATTIRQLAQILSEGALCISKDRTSN